MRLPTLLLALSLVLVSCGRLLTAPATTPAPSPRDQSPSSASALGFDSAAPGDTVATMPEVHSVRVERAGDDVRVVLVGRPPTPGAHPTIGPFYSSGIYVFGFAMHLNEPGIGYYESLSAFSLDARHVAVGLVPIIANRAAPDTNPPYYPYYTVLPLHGDGTSWNFRFPASTALTIGGLGGVHFRWDLTLHVPRTTLQQDYHGTVTLAGSERPSFVEPTPPTGQ